MELFVFHFLILQKLAVFLHSMEIGNLRNSNQQLAPHDVDFNSRLAENIEFWLFGGGGNWNNTPQGSSKTKRIFSANFISVHFQTTRATARWPFLVFDAFKRKFVCQKSIDGNSGYHKIDVFYCLYYCTQSNTRTHSTIRKHFCNRMLQKKGQMCWPTDWLMESDNSLYVFVYSIIYRLKRAINIIEEFSHHLFIFANWRFHAYAYRTYSRTGVWDAFWLCMKCAQGITAIQFYWQLNEVDLYFSNAHIFQPIRIVSFFITFRNVDFIFRMFASKVHKIRHKRTATGARDSETNAHETTFIYTMYPVFISIQ